jgi:hypothetical protein
VRLAIALASVRPRSRVQSGLKLAWPLPMGQTPSSHIVALSRLTGVGLQPRLLFPSQRLPAGCNARCTSALFMASAAPR